MFRAHALRWTNDKEGVSLTKPVTVIIRTITVLRRRSGNAVTLRATPYSALRLALRRFFREPGLSLAGGESSRLRLRRLGQPLERRLRGVEGAGS